MLASVGLAVFFVTAISLFFGRGITRQHLAYAVLFMDAKLQWDIESPAAHRARVRFLRLVWHWDTYLKLRALPFHISSPFL